MVIVGLSLVYSEIGNELKQERHKWITILIWSESIDFPKLQCDFMLSYYKSRPVSNKAEKLRESGIRGYIQVTNEDTNDK